MFDVRLGGCDTSTPGPVVGTRVWRRATLLPTSGPLSRFDLSGVPRWLWWSKPFGIPFWLVGAPPMLVYFSGDWDIVTHGLIHGSNAQFAAARLLASVLVRLTFRKWLPKAPFFSQAKAWMLLGNIFHFCLLWFSGNSPLNC